MRLKDVRCGDGVFRCEGVIGTLMARECICMSSSCGEFSSQTIQRLLPRTKGREKELTKGSEIEREGLRPSEGASMAAGIGRSSDDQLGWVKEPLIKWREKRDD
ncbi:MAG: hypothetical protein Q9172_003651 [Xanthocarpia lactea]